MTLIHTRQEDSGGFPLVGSLQITVDDTLYRPGGLAVQPVPRSFDLDANGEVTVDLEPSEIAQVTYLFEVLDANGQLVAPPFRTEVPDSGTTLELNDLRPLNISTETLRSSLTDVVQALFTLPRFWDQMQAQIFPRGGQWSSTALYRRGTLVEYAGSTWLYNQQAPTAGVVPGSEAPEETSPQWVLFAQRGQDGAGTSGAAEPYGMGWDGSPDAPTKDDVYDGLEALADLVGDQAPLDSPTFTGDPRGPSTVFANPSGLHPNRLATLGYVQGHVANATLGSCPVGSSIHFWGSSPPLGWDWCDGRSLLKTAFQALWLVLGPASEDPNDSLRFLLPDTRGRALVGLDEMDAVEGPAGLLSSARGGQVSSPLPQHNHLIEGALDATATPVATYKVAVTDANNAAVNLLTDNRGTGPSGISTLQPYQAAGIIIYHGVI